MKQIYYILFISILLTLSGCSWTHQLQMSTLRPAQVQYHRAYPNVIVVNNSIAPNSKENSRFIDANGKQYRIDFSTDSIPYLMAMSLGTLLHDSYTFNNVEVLLPDSNEITGIEGINTQQKTKWQEIAPNDVHIVINAIRPMATMSIIPLDGLFCSELVIASVAQLQCIIPGKEDIYLTVNDTLYCSAYGETPEIAQMYLPDFNECIEEAVVSLSQQALPLLAHHQSIVERCIFITGHPAMKDAFRYWENNQHLEASYIWKYVYNLADNKGRRAKAAANLAVYYELNDNYEKALKYAQEAAKTFVELKNTTEAEYAINYGIDLEKRIKERHILHPGQQ